MLLIPSLILPEIILEPETYITTSYDGQSYFKMIPRKGGFAESDYGMAYKVTANANDSLLWDIEVYYTSNVHISNSGEYLIWEAGVAGRPYSDSDVAVAFYKNGKLLSAYTVGDLVKDTTQFVRSMGHYVYQEYTQFNEYQSSYKFVTVDQLSYQFDIKTGKIKSVKTVGFIDEFLGDIENWAAMAKFLSLVFFTGVFVGILAYYLGLRILSYKRNKKVAAS